MSTPALQAKDVHRRYVLSGHELQVLRGANLTVKRGERVFLCGPSGAGKTSLLYVLAGLERPTKGTVEIDGAPVYPDTRLFGFVPEDFFVSWPLWLQTFVFLFFKVEMIIWCLCETFFNFRHDRKQGARNKNVGFVFQHYFLLPELTALENVKLPAMIGKKASDQRARELLARVGLSERMDHLPTELSGGEQQRVAIARALINDPGILFADEPTGNLDAGTGGGVMDMLLSVVAETQKTLIVVTHDTKLAERGDRKLVLRDGLLEE